jgi:hypothetical protein
MMSSASGTPSIAVGAVALPAVVDQLASVCQSPAVLPGVKFQ